jgi:hypothetical protein
MIHQAGKGIKKSLKLGDDVVNDGVIVTGKSKEYLALNSGVIQRTKTGVTIQKIDIDDNVT